MTATCAAAAADRRIPARREPRCQPSSEWEPATIPLKARTTSFHTMIAAENRRAAAVFATATSGIRHCMFRFSPTTTTGAREVPKRTFHITAPRHASSRSRSRRRVWGAALALGVFAGIWTDSEAFEPSVNYMLQCMGCHTPDGRGEPGHVPSIRDTLVPFANTAEGRKFLVQVPGSAQSKLSDAELADVLNWMIDNLSATPRPAQLTRFTAVEVAAYRRTPLVSVAAVRAQLVAAQPAIQRPVPTPAQ